MGISNYGEEFMLDALLPNGTNVEIALLTTLPTADDGTGLVECSGSGYARKTHAAWITTTAAADTVRANNGAIEFTALTAALSSVLGWAVYDASGANLLAYGPIKDVGGNEVTLNFIATDQPRFVDGELGIGISEVA